MKYLWLILWASTASFAQEAAKLSARELFYREDSAAPLAPSPKPKPKPKPAEPTTTTPTGVPVVPAAMHLGVRYNVLQITDRETKRRKLVDPDKVFKAGDCVAIELTPNRSAYLYVFNRASSGAWQRLLPSPDMPGERRQVSNGQTTIIPSEHCFEFDQHAGTETLLVLLTQNEDDVRRLGEAVRTGAPSDPAAPSAPAMLAGGRVPQQLEMMRDGQMIGRDIRMAKIGSPQQDGEPPNSVYAVRTSASTSDRLVLEIRLRHD
jgi:hypothetical protein